MTTGPNVVSHEYWARGVTTAGFLHAKAVRARIAQTREHTALDIADARKALARLEEADAEMAASVAALDVEIAKVAP